MLAQIKSLEEEKNRLCLLCEMQREELLEELEDLDRRTHWMQQAYIYGQAASPVFKFAMPVAGILLAGRLKGLMRAGLVSKVVALVNIARQLGPVFSGIRAVGSRMAL